MGQSIFEKKRELSGSNFADAIMLHGNEGWFGVIVHTVSQSSGCIQNLLKRKTAQNFPYAVPVEQVKNGKNVC
jgi:hypothetical protein